MFPVDVLEDDLVAGDAVATVRHPLLLKVATGVCAIKALIS